MLRWYFSYAFVDRFASHLLDRVTTPARTKKQTITPSLRSAIGEAADFQRREKLNFFQRARLAQQLQNRLLARGFDTQTARNVAIALSQSTKVGRLQIGLEP